MSLLTGTKSAATFVFNHPTVSSIVSTLNNVTTVGRLVDYSIDSGNIDKDLAIIGMSCRFPGGVEFPAMFWDLIKSGECTSEEVPFSFTFVVRVQATLVSLEIQRKCLSLK